VRGDSGRLAACTRPCQSAAAPPVAALARGGAVPEHTPAGVATLAAAGGAGHLGGPPNPGVGVMEVRTRAYALVDPVTRLVAQQGRIGPAHSQTTGLGRTASANTRRDYRVAGSDGARMEPSSHSLCVEWEASLATSTESPASASARRLWRLCPP